MRMSRCIVGGFFYDLRSKNQAIFWTRQSTRLLRKPVIFYKSDGLEASRNRLDSKFIRKGTAQRRHHDLRTTVRSTISQQANVIAWLIWLKGLRF